MRKTDRLPEIPQTSNLAIVHKVEFDSNDELCHPALRTSLELEAIELLGEADHIIPGKLYMLRGTYTCAAPDVEKLRLSIKGQCGGTEARVGPGSGQFEVTAEPLELAKGQENTLDLLAYGPEDHLLGIRMSFVLKSPPQTQTAES